MRGAATLCGAVMLAGLAPALPLHAQEGAAPLPLLDVPFISQSEALCGGAAAAMILRYWGERGVSAETFAHLVERTAGGIRTGTLTGELQRLGWTAVGRRGTAEDLRAELSRGRPVLALIEDRPSRFHYVVVVGWHPRGVVLHDPARAPFVAMSTEAFVRKWHAAERWMAVIVPAADRARSDEAREVAADPEPPEFMAAGACGQAVAAGIRYARANDLDMADRTLAAALACPEALRELAGVRVLQKRWSEAEDLAAAAIAAGDEDPYVWKVLATARFVRDDRLGALAAWNRTDEPRLDIVAIDGLTRTRHRVVERLLRLDPGTVLTPAHLVRARRQLTLLPPAASARLDYVPVGSGLAEVRAVVAERPVLPHGALPLAAAGLVAAATRELRVRTGSLAGGGDAISAAWRFWPDRERVGFGVETPGPGGAIWSVDLFSERQPFTDVAVPQSERTGAHAGAAAWLTDRVYLRLSAGVDEWKRRATLASADGRVRVLSPDDRVEIGAGVRRWMGDDGFTLVDVGARLRLTSDRPSRARPSGGSRVVLGELGWQGATGRTPLDLWPSGDTGHASATPLRAHPVLDGGRLRTERLGRMLAYASVEGQRWWAGRGPVGIGAAVFGDAAWTSRRLSGPPLKDVDVGLGARLSVAGVPGVFRVDIGKGLRDGAAALSVSYAP